MTGFLYVNATYRTSGARTILNNAKKGLGDRATISALNKTAAQAQTQMSRLIREDYRISASDVRDRLRIRRAAKRGEYSFEAALLGNANNRGRAMNLIRFLEANGGVKAYKRGKGGRLDQLRFQIKKGKGRAIVEGAFIGNKGRTVFQRTGRGRLPIKPVQTIGVPQMFNTKKNRAAVERFINEAFPRIYEREAAYYLSTLNR